MTGMRSMALLAPAVLVLAGCTAGASATSSPTSSPATSPHGAHVHSLHEKKPAASPTTSAHAGPLSFSQSAHWSDGFEVRIVKVTNGAVYPRDVGGARGSGKTTFTVRVSNGDRVPYDLSGVDLSVAYGGRRASRVTNANMRHGALTGSLAPRMSATARFAYAIPVSGRGLVTLTVTPRFYGPVVFSGSVG